MRGVTSDFMLWLPHLVVKLVESENDGLVAAHSATHWENSRIWRGARRRGISHVDSVDIRRRPLTRRAAEGSDADTITDIVPAYVGLVEELVAAGL